MARSTVSHPRNAQLSPAPDWVETFAADGMKGWTLTKLQSNRIGFGLGAAGSVTTGRLDVPEETWIHVAARRKDGELSILMDGELIASAPMADTSLTIDSAAALKFGHRGSPEDTRLARYAGSTPTATWMRSALYVGQGLSDEAIRHVFRARTSFIE
jgi:hypothetical protein